MHHGCCASQFGFQEVLRAHRIEWVNAFVNDMDVVSIGNACLA